MICVTGITLKTFIISIDSERTHAEYPMPIYGDNYSNGSALPISDLVERGDYLRLKNVSLVIRSIQRTGRKR